MASIGKLGTPAKVITVKPLEKPTGPASPPETQAKTEAPQSKFDAQTVATREKETGSQSVGAGALRSLRESYGPAGDLLALTGGEVDTVNGRKTAFAETAALKARFEADVSAAKSPAELKALEAKYPPKDLSAGMQARLMKGYMDASAWPEAAGYYESLLQAEPEFAQYDIPREFYVVSLNKSGQLATSVREAVAYLGDHGVDMRAVLAQAPVPKPVSGEVFGGLGKAFKVLSGKAEKGELDAGSKELIRQFATEAKLPAGDADLARSALILSTRFYESGFTQDFEFYPGINAVYNAYATGDTARAEALAPMVMHACQEQGGLRSPDYWNLTTQLELSIMLRDPEAAKQVLPLVLKNGDLKGWMLDSTATNIEGLAKRRAAAGENTALPDFISGKLRELQKAEPPAKAEWLAQMSTELAAKFGPTAAAGSSSPNAKASAAVLDNSHTFKQFVSSYALGGNVQFGGQIPDICVSRETLDLVRGVIDSLGLSKVDDFEKWDKKVDGFLSRTYKLDDPLGNRRPLEDLHSPEHKVMDDFRKNLLKLMDTTDSKDSRTDLGVELALGSGDCRHVAYSKQLLFDVWKRNRQVTGMRTAYTALQNGDMPAHQRAMAQVKQLDHQQLAVFTVTVKAPVKMNAMYDMVLDGQGRAVRDDKLNDVEMHTLNAVLDLSDSGEVEHMQWRDSFYRQLYPWGHRDADISQMLSADGFDGGPMAVTANDAQSVNVRMVPAAYSKGAAKQGLSAGEMLLAGQEVAPFSRIGFTPGKTADALVLAIANGG